MVNTRELKAQMVRKGLTQEALAEKLHISGRTMNAKLNGRNSFYVDEAKALIDLLELENPDAIFFADKVDS